MSRPHKTVQIRFNITLPMQVPEDWEERKVNSYLENTFCYSNLIEKIAAVTSDGGPGAGCACRGACDATGFWVSDEPFDG